MGDELMSGEVSLNYSDAAHNGDALLDTFANKHDSLAAAFAFFNETSQQLTQSYHLLEQKVAQLNAELQRVSAEKDEEQTGRQQLANRMQALLEVLPAGVIVLDTRGRVLDANPAAETLLATPLTGRIWRDVIAQCFAPQNDDGLEVSTKTGRRISVATSSLDAGHKGQRAGGQIVLLTDLTETRRLQQHVSRSERLSAMGKMVSALAHQVRTPLSAAMLYAEHLCHPKLDGKRRVEFSQKLYGRLQHMERQVRDMLLFVKSELPLNELISTQDLVQGLKAAAELPLETSKSCCSWNIESDLVIKCNREALISAIMNLVNNAIQAVEQAAELRLSLWDETASDGAARQLCIQITDNGPGMPPELLTQATDIFVTTKSQGTGLGLAVVQQVVRAHGGSFNLMSPPGKGVTALLKLPVYDTTLCGTVATPE